MSLQSDDLNLLIFRYLEESGFAHSAFTFSQESRIHHMSDNSSMVPPGALISIVLKGLLYTEAEISLNEDGTQLVDQQPMTLLECVTPDVLAARQRFQGGVVATHATTTAAATTTNIPPAVVPVAETESIPTTSRAKTKSDSSTGSAAVRVKTESSSSRDVKSSVSNGRVKPETIPRVKSEAPARVKVEVKAKPEPRPVEVPVPMDTSGSADVKDTANTGVTPLAVSVAPPAPHTAAVAVEDLNSQVAVKSPPPVLASTAPAPVTPSPDTECRATVLRGHSSEVFICAWNPKTDVLASGAGDGTACIWKDGMSTVLEHKRSQPLMNGNGGGQENAKGTTDVTSVDWNQDGTLLATASYDHFARVWDSQGALLHELSGHQGPIFAIKWNKKGSFLLTGSVDKTAMVWDAHTGAIKQQFAFHTAPCLDIDWQGNSIFATCSQDQSINICRVGYDKPIKVFRGHTNEVNTVRWNPAGNILASCSDDHTAKLWTTREDSFVHNLESHTREIYTIKWSRTGPFTQYPNAPLRLATASFDSTVRLWDADSGQSLSCLRGHGEAVYSVAFNPDAQLLASGSFDNCVHIWSTKDAQLLHKFKGGAGVFEVCFNRDGTKVAASSADHSVVVLDIRNLQTRLN